MKYDEQKITGNDITKKKGMFKKKYITLKEKHR